MGAELLNCLSAAQDAILTTDYRDNYIARGQCFGISKNFAVNSGATKTFLLDPTAYKGFAIVTFPLKYHVTSGYVQVYISVDSDYSGGTALSLTNRNNMSNITAVTKINQDATGNNIGTVISEDLIGFKHTNQISGGGNNAAFEPFWLRTDKKYLIRFVNQSGENIELNIKFILFEI